MEDIYDDLNNYEDVNCVRELRNENTELKVKLKEHAAAMEKLQKDYDKLEMEFKKLENNYSSLLKTARSEIERKTQRITQLNMDKDLMVLESLKNGKHIRRNFNKSVLSQMQGNKKMEDNARLKNIDKRFRTAGVQTENYSNTGADKRNSMVKLDNISAKADPPYKTRSTIREKPTNHKTEYNDTPKPLAGSIKDRRKSMPVVSMPVDKFSSDEENEHTYSIRETKTAFSALETFERRNANKFPNDRHSNRTSETSSIDDRVSSYHESTLRERSGTRRHDNNMYRSRDKYKASQKYRKDYSPERGQKREHSHSDYQDDYYRQDKGRYRPRDNPLSENNRHQRRNFEHRANFERHDQDKYRHYQEEKYGSKQKSLNDYQEPLAKRKKTEYFWNSDTQDRVEKDYYIDKEPMDIQSSVKLSPHQYDALRFSCQSPDYVHTDITLEHPIREIMATATTPLEDPRVKSKRYAIIQENGKETLSAVVGKNVDIKSVNKAVWNIKHVNIPDALVRPPPSLSSYELVKDMGINIGSPVGNISLESGEIHLESDNEGYDNHDKPKVISHAIRHVNTSRQKPEQLSEQVNNVEEISKRSRNEINKYRIPKIGQTNRSAQSKKDVPIIEVNESAPTKNHTKIVTEEHDSSKKLVTRQQNVNLANNENYSNHDKMESKNKETLSKMAIVADDLELSDENSDNVDSHRQITAETIAKCCKVQPKIRQKDNSTSDTKEDYKNTATATETKNPVDIVEVKAVEVDEKANTKGLLLEKSGEDCSKKQKSKKKKPKSKEASKDSLDSTNAILLTEKKKTKKEKECKPKEANAKFSDLFGDSSSLMTPEDLGIPSYLPVSEDAQDAVDLKINQIIDASPIINQASQESPGADKAQSSIQVEKPIVQPLDNNAEINYQILNTNDKEVTKDIKKKNVPKRKEEIETDKISPSDIYENLNPDIDETEPDIVKTVIISTGVQPQIKFENNSELVLENNADAKVHKKTIADCSLRQDNLKALATSTPQKETVLNPPIEIRTKDVTTDSSYNDSVDSSSVQAVNLTKTNMPDSEDAPDVRIFVKRRRKGIKRPLLT